MNKGKAATPDPRIGGSGKPASHALAGRDARVGRRSGLARLLLGVDLPGARCAGQAPDFDDVVPGETPEDRAARLETCRVVCTTCPARLACRAASQALPKGGRSGVWAGHVHSSRGGATTMTQPKPTAAELEAVARRVAAELATNAGDRHATTRIIAAAPAEALRLTLHIVVTEVVGPLLTELDSATVESPAPRRSA